MVQNIGTKIEDVINKRLLDNPYINIYIEANKEYNKLVQRGITVKRGFNLMTKEDIYSRNMQYTYSQFV